MFLHWKEPHLKTFWDQLHHDRLLRTNYEKEDGSRWLHKGLVPQHSRCIDHRVHQDSLSGVPGITKFAEKELRSQAWHDRQSAQGIVTSMLQKPFILGVCNYTVIKQQFNVWLHCYYFVNTQPHVKIRLLKKYAHNWQHFPFCNYTSCCIVTTQQSLELHTVLLQCYSLHCCPHHSSVWLLYFKTIQ